ncbi:MAG: cytochrome c oxidase accessory protein CcoG [Polyangiaceae bacterium]|jgi:cytochrome c oxidase accessory protein FixG|nr:cytochrome c oxidase accessory protein CcoG [Polyangiaceae bacterium]
MPTRHLPVIAQGGSSSLGTDGRRRLVVPADVRGRFQWARRVAFAALVALWAALPVVHVGGAPAVFLDVDARRFYLFGLTFNAQDAWLVFFGLTGFGFGLVYATALAGRVWCGWACPQTVFLEGLFRPIERLFEGPREKRLRRDAGPVTLERALRKAGKHAAFVVLAFVVAHLFLAYFVSWSHLPGLLRSPPFAHPEAFAWAIGTTTLLYVNFAWFREQFCVVLCPYGRLQSVLLDSDSLVVGYDAARGEPRGKVGRPGAGDCVDCGRCVVVCPTGIDIRNGLQLDCIACTACIDACDAVMDKLDRPRGLVRYDSQNGLAGRPRRLLRPRLALYTALLAIGASVTAVAARGRRDFEATLARLPGAPYTLEGGEVRNAFQLHLVNKRAGREAFSLRVEAPSAVVVVLPLSRVEVEGLGDARVPVFLSIPRGSFERDEPVRVVVRREGAPPSEAFETRATFLGAK